MLIAVLRFLADLVGQTFFYLLVIIALSSVVAFVVGMCEEIRKLFFRLEGKWFNVR